MNILYIDKYIAVVEKPSNMPSQSDKTGSESLLDLVKKKTGYAAIMNRLDRNVGGLVVFALDEKCCKSLKDFQKEYEAVVCGAAPQKEALLRNNIVTNERTNTSKISKEGKEAVLKYNLLKETDSELFQKLSLLRVCLYTGRHHQIRLQLANIGIPIWGDVKYNEKFGKGGTFYKVALNEGIEIIPALWAAKISFAHPISGERLEFYSKPGNYPFTEDCFKTMLL